MCMYVDEYLEQSWVEIECERNINEHMEYACPWIDTREEWTKTLWPFNFVQEFRLNSPSENSNKCLSSYEFQTWYTVPVVFRCFGVQSGDHGDGGKALPSFRSRNHWWWWRYLLFSVRVTKCQSILFQSISCSSTSWIQVSSFAFHW